MRSVETGNAVPFDARQQRFEPFPTLAPPQGKRSFPHREPFRRSPGAPPRSERTTMERTARIATGESVAFSYELAGVGSRFFAVFIDMALQLAVVVVLVLAFVLVTRTVPAAAHLAPAAKFGKAVLTAVAVAAGFVLFFGYFIIFEWRWQGRTPGKKVLGIRVVRDGGFPLDLTSSVIRNVVRLLELGVGLYALSAVATLLSPANRRFGDMAAGTIVIRDNRFERPLALVAVEEREVDDPLVAGLTLAQRDLVRRYALRRAALAPEYRTAVAAEIAAGVRPRLSMPFDHLDDDDLLGHLAATALGPARSSVSDS